jgi:predicted ATPase
VEHADNPRGHSGGAPSSPLAVQLGRFVQHGEDWTIGYGAETFPLRNVLGLTYIQRLLQHPGEQFHALDLLSGTTSSEFLEADASRLTRSRDDDNLVVGRPGDTGPILDEQAKRDYRRRVSELNEELNELRERGNRNLLGERDYQRREEVESEIEALTRQLAQAVGMFGRDRRSGSAAERARLNVTRAIRSAIQKISERNAQLGQLLGTCIRTGSFCCYIPDPRAPIEWKLAVAGAMPAPMAGVPAPATRQSEPNFIQPLASRTAFVGREEERELLRSCLQKAKNGQGRIVVIAGPPGIGKTRTAREAGEEARQRGFVALAGNCYDRENSVPFVPFVELMETALERAPGLAAVRETLGDQAAELTRLLPQLRRLFPDLPQPLQLSPEQSRRMLFNAVLDLFERQSALNPFLLLLEDLHWADEGTLSLLVHLGRTISRMPMMVIATHRDDDIDMKPPLTKALDELFRLRVVERITLRGLAERAVAQMIEVLSGQEPSPALVDLIYSSSDGNPLFVEELIRDLDQRQPNGDLLQRLEVGEITLPHSLRLVIGRRLALVSKEATRVLGTAAVIGRSFNFGLLEAATHAEPDQLVDSLEEAEKAGLISSRLEYPEARFKFAHELIRRAVLDEISVARRQRLHLNIAQAMELHYANSLDEHAEDLAHHFWSAGAAADPAKAIRYLQMAGEKAVRSSANLEAIGHFRKALQRIATVPETPERLRQELSLHTTLGTTLLPTTGFSSHEVKEAYARARELSQRAGETQQFFRVLFGQWLSHAARAEHRMSLELGEQCLHLAQSAGDPDLLLEAHHALGVALLGVGDLGRALEHLEKAVAIYDPQQHSAHAQIYGHDPAAVCLMHAGWALWLLGRPDQALKKGNESLVLAHQLVHPSTLATAAAWVACLQQWCGNLQEVEELSASAIVISTEHNFGYYKAMALILGGWALVQRQQTSEGIEQMRLGLEAFQAMGGIAISSYFAGLLAEAYAAAGQAQEALKILGRVEEDMEPWWKAELYRLRGEILRRALQGAKVADQDEAAQYFRKAIDIARTQNAKSLELRASMSLSRLWLAQSKHFEARRTLTQIMGSFAEGFDTRDLREAQLLLQQL